MRRGGGLEYGDGGYYAGGGEVVEGYGSQNSRNFRGSGYRRCILPPTTSSDFSLTQFPAQR